MKNSLYVTALIFVTYLVVSCQLPDDSTLLTDQSAKQTNHDGSAYIAASAEFITLSQKNQVDVSIKTDYEAQNGILHFKDLDTYVSVRNSLKQISIADRLKKTKITNFTSLLASYQEYFDDIEQDSLNQGKDVIAKKYGDIISPVNNEGKQQLLNSSSIESALLNRAGLVYIGKILYRFTDKQQDIVADGDLSKIGSTNQMVYSLNSPTTTLTKQGRLAADPCNSIWRNSYSPDQQRQIALNVYLKKTQYVTGSNSRVECMPFAFAVPYKKRNHADGSYEWVNYRTINNLSSIWRCSVRRGDNFESKVANDNYFYDNDWNFIDYGGTVLTFENVPYGYGTPSPQFESLFEFGGGYYWSRGVPFDQRVNMECP